MANALHQINLKFVPEQDRILLRVRTQGGEEVALSLTRRFVRALWPALLDALGRDPKISSHAPTPDARQAVMAFRHEHAVKSSDFSQPYKEREKAEYGGPPSPAVQNLAPAPDPATAAAHDPAEPMPEPLPEPMLVVGCQIKMTGPERASVSFQTAERKAVSIAVNFDMIHGICRLIQQAVASADWGLSLEFLAQTEAPRRAAGPVH
ncbi:MAG: hypothetical protein ACKVSF_06830 [Alphaproteobacteria bacterium]